MVKGWITGIEGGALWRACLTKTVVFGGKCILLYWREGAEGKGSDLPPPALLFSAEAR